MADPRSTRPPNIVLILADNLGWGELGCYGGGMLRGAPTELARINAAPSAPGRAK